MPGKLFGGPALVKSIGGVAPINANRSLAPIFKSGAGVAAPVPTGGDGTIGGLTPAQRLELLKNIAERIRTGQMTSPDEVRAPGVGAGSSGYGQPGTVNEPKVPRTHKFEIQYGGGLPGGENQQVNESVLSQTDRENKRAVERWARQTLSKAVTGSGVLSMPFIEGHGPIMTEPEYAFEYGAAAPLKNFAEKFTLEQQLLLIEHNVIFGSEQQRNEGNPQRKILGIIDRYNKRMARLGNSALVYHDC